MHRLFTLLFLSFFSCISIAQTVEVSVLIDRGGSGGCTVTAVDPISGVDARLTASVDSATAQVDTLTLEHCAGGSFGTAQTLASGYPVGLNNGESGADVVELSLAAAELGIGSTQFVFTMMADDGSSVDQAAGGMAGTSFPVPLAPWALLLLAIMVVIMGFWALRRHRGPTALLLGLLAVSAWAAHFMLDGEVADWTGVSPISDPAGDPTNGGNRADILAVFSAEENGQLWFRVDLADIENGSPTAADDALATDEDTLLSGENVLADNGAGVDSDPDGDPLTVTAFDAVSTQGAAVTIAANGDLDYDPTGASALQGLAVGESVDDTFTYTIEDPDGSSDTATVTVSVAGVNDPPTASDDAFATDKNTPVTTTSVLTNDTDPDVSDSLSVDSIDTTTTVGVVTDNGDGTFDYDPDGQFDGLGEGDSDTDSFIYTVTDGNGGTDTATVTITITGANTAPVATDDAFVTDEDSALTTGDVLANDTDTEGDALSIDSVDTTGTVGLVTDNGDGTFGYDPNGQFEALAQGDSDTDSFIYTVTDGNGGTDSATVTITINGLNDAPTAGNDAFATDEDVELVVPALGVLANDNDVDSGDTLTAVLDSDVSDGTLTLNADGSFSYTPDPDFNGTDAFTYHATDGTADSAIATVTITVNSINDPPTANDDAFTVDEDTTDNVFDVLANDTDAPDTGETLTITAVGAPSQGGTATTGGTDITYTPAPDFSGIEIFTYTIDDGNGGADPATVTVTVSGVDDPPTAVDDTATLTEDDPATIINVLANDTDVDGGPIGITSVTQPANGMVVNNGTDLSYAPNPNYCNDGSPTDDFTYTLNGGSTATVAVAVTCVNDPPLADDEIISAACNIESVVETDPGQSAAATGAVFRTVADNVLDGDSDPVEGTAVAIVQADGQTSDTTAPFQITTNEGGSLTLHADGSFTYTPEAGDRSVADTFTYTIEDADGGQDSATVTLNVGGTCVWFVDNSAGADDTGTGTSSDPFTSLVDELGPDALPDDAEDASVAGDVIYVFEGNSTSGDPYDGNFSAEAGERLLGQGVDLVMDFGSGPETLFTGNVANRPLVVGVSGGVAVSVIDVTGVEVAGLELAGGDHAVSVSGISGAFGLNLHFNEMSGSSNEAISVNQSGAFDSTLAITANAVTAATGDSLNVEVSNGTLALAIDGNALTSMANGIDLDGSGALLHVTSFCGNTLSGDIGGIGVVARDVIFDADPSDADFTGDQVGCTGIPTSIGSAVNPVAFAMLLEDVAGDLAFGTLDLYSDGVGQVGLEVTGTGALNAAAGTGFAITSTGGTVDSANGPALTLYDSTLGLTLTGVTSNDSPSNGVLLNAVTGTLSVTGGTTITNSAGLAIDATASPGVAVDFDTTSIAGSDGGIRLASSPGADFTFASLDVTTTGTALDVNNAGTVNIGGVANTLETTAGAAIRAQLTSMGVGGWTFDNVTSDNSPSVGILFNAMTGGNFLVTGATDINEPMATGIEVSTGGARTYDFGSTDISGAGSVVPLSGGRGVNAIFGNSMSSLIFDSLNITTDNGAGLVTNGVGLLAIAGTTNSIVASNGNALWLESTTVDELPGGPVTGITFATVSSANSPLDGINLQFVTGSVTGNAGSITGALDAAVRIGSAANNSGGNGNVTYAGSITNSADRAILVQERNGGTVTFSGAIVDNGASNSGIFLDNIDLGTVQFTGTVDITGTSGAGVTYQNSGGGTTSFADLDIDNSGTNQIALFATNNTGGGTLNVTTGTVHGGSNTAVDIDNTVLGLTLFSVDSIGGGSVGIDLASTTGSFTVTGDGATGGAGLFADNNGSGGTITGKTGNGVRLADVTNVSLNYMNLSNNLGNGIHGTNVNGFVLTRTNLSANGDAVDESGLRFGLPDGSQNGLIGSTLAGVNPTRISHVDISASSEHNVEIINTAGVLTNLLVENSRFRDTSTSGLGADGFQTEMRSSAIGTINVTGSTFSGNATQGFQGQAIDSSSLEVNVSGSTFTNNNEGLVLSTAGGGDLSFDISNNPTFTDHEGVAIFVGTTSSATAASTVTGRITNNTNIQTPATGVNHSVVVFPSGASSAIVLLDGNTISNDGFFRGINVTTTDNVGDTPSLDVTITNNTVTNGANADHAILVEGRNSASVCAKLEGNTATAVSATKFGVRLRERDSSTVQLEQGSSGSSDPATVLGDNNPASVGFSVTGAPAVVANNTCTQAP